MSILHIGIAAVVGAVIVAVGLIVYIHYDDWTMGR